MVVILQHYFESTPQYVWKIPLVAGGAVLVYHTSFSCETHAVYNHTPGCSYAVFRKEKENKGSLC